MKLDARYLPLIMDMMTTFWNETLFLLQQVGVGFHAILWPHIIAFGGFALALLVVARLFSERRTPSNTLAWSLIIFFAPYVGVPLYFLFGGRKSRRLVAHKKAIRTLAESVYYAKDHPDHTPPIWQHLPLPAGGNSFELLPDGTACFKAFLQAIDEAQETIDIATYILGKDHIGQTIVQHLCSRASAGVQVRLMVDALGSWGAGGRFLNPLREAGGQVARFMPMLPLQTQTSSNLRNHRKMAIFDHKQAIIGGQNLDHRFMGTLEVPALFNDFSTLISGPAVAQLNRIFVGDWCFAAKEKPLTFKDALRYTPTIAGQESIRVISSGPDVEGDPLWESLITLIQDCNDSLTLVTPYFLPDESLFRSLLVKARTGRHVRLILPEKSNHALVDIARQSFLRRLHEAGAEILLYTPGMLHAKLFIVDQSIAMIGSANFDLRSLFVNFEVGVFLTSPGALNSLRKWTDVLVKDCRPYHGVGKPSASRQWLEDVAHILAPLL